MLIDTHCHFFTKRVMTESITRLEGAITRLDKISQSIASNDKDKNQITTLGLNTIDFVNTAVQNSPMDLYNIMEENYGCDFIAVPLMMDLSYTFLAPEDKTLENKKSLARTLKNISQKRRSTISNTKIIKFTESIENSLDIFDRSVIGTDVFERSYEEQIKDLTGVKEQLGDKVYPFFSVDPRRNEEFDGGILSEIMRYVGKNKPFHGLKLYTSLGYSPTHPVLYDNSEHESVYGYLEKHQIPVTVHSSLEGFSHMLEANHINGDIYYPASGLPVPADHVYANGIVKYDKNLKSLYFSELTSERLLMLNHPALWKKVLTKYPNLKINLAHFGGIIQMSKFVNGNQTGFWTKYIIDLMEEFPNVYTDLSCYYNYTGDDNYLEKIYKEVYLILSDSLKGRVMYGSDYYMITLFNTNLGEYIERFRKAFGKDFTKISEDNPRSFLDI